MIGRFLLNFLLVMGYAACVALVGTLACALLVYLLITFGAWGGLADFVLVCAWITLGITLAEGS